jgi:hypothetical protein
MMRFDADRKGEYDQAVADEVVADAWSWSRPVVFLGLSAYLLFAHGCHGDEDHELFVPAARCATACTQAVQDDCIYSSSARPPSEEPLLEDKQWHTPTERGLDL